MVHVWYECGLSVVFSVCMWGMCVSCVTVWLCVMGVCAACTCGVGVGVWGECVCIPVGVPDMCRWVGM